MIESTLIYRSFWEAMKKMPDEERHILMDCIFEYSFDGVEPDIEDHPWAMSTFLCIKPNIDSRNDAVLAGKKGGRPTERGVSEITKGGFSKNEKDPFENFKTKAEAEAEAEVKAEVKKSKAHFVAPTLQEVREYCLERKNKVDPEQFIDFYSSKGWKVGSQPMKDWKAAVRTWEKRDSTRQSEQKAKNKFNRFEQRDYDFDALEAELLGIGGTA